MNKLQTALGAVALLCASQANAAVVVYNEVESNDSPTDANLIGYDFTPNDNQLIINYFGSLANEISGSDWFAFDIPAVTAGVSIYSISIFAAGLAGGATPDLSVIDLTNNRPIGSSFNTQAAGRYAVGLRNAVAGGTGAYRANVVIDVIPEPATWALMLAGFGMVGYALRRRRAQLAVG